ncbi:MAG: hypothetical protein NC131_06855 [Roseburia sp.]|nr:hypothetical protein [Roseburia sp.]
MEKQNIAEKTEKTEQTGDELLREYIGQDKDDKHNMGYSVYTRTDDGCCC